MAHKRLTRSAAEAEARRRGYSHGTSDYASFVNAAVYTGVDISSFAGDSDSGSSYSGSGGGGWDSGGSSSSDSGGASGGGGGE